MYYKECLDDIEIAKQEITNMKIYPDNVVADLYYIPSHNHQAFYVLLSRDNKDYTMTYIKPLIYTVEWEFPIKMYPFADCKMAERHLAKQGQFVMGIKTLTNDFVDKLLMIMEAIPNRFIFEKDNISIDGITHGIRVFGKESKEVFFYDAKKIKDLSSENCAILELLFLDIETMIES